LRAIDFASLCQSRIFPFIFCEQEEVNFTQAFLLCLDGLVISRTFRLKMIEALSSKREAHLLPS
jgi:hypothetical protein